jgi:hypothetical protein
MYEIENGSSISKKAALNYINKSSVDKDHIIFHPYENMSVTNSFKLSDDEIAQQSLPKGILDIGTFDIIIIDGPTGWLPNQPGRLLPYFWTKNYLSHLNTIIYCDDTERPLETYSVNKYFKDFPKTIFTSHKTTIKMKF